MTSFEWFLLIVVVIVVPLIVAVVVTLWTIDQANKRKRANRKDAQIGVKRQAALSPEEVAERKAARARNQEDIMANDVNTNNPIDEDAQETPLPGNDNIVNATNINADDLAAADDAAAMAEEASESSADTDVIEGAADEEVEEPNLG